MKNFSKTLLAFALMTVFCGFSFGADTLEVYVLRVQFEQEQNDNSLTTGDGTFGSDTKKKDAYKLDPPSIRGKASYWKDHLEFANNYYNAVSGGKLVIKSKIFPETSNAYNLKTQIIDYNRTSKLKGEKTEAFDEARSRDYMQFIYDAVMAAHESGKSPFAEPLPESPNTKRVYMIAHAGASRLVDGGSMGTKGADTPGDFMDVYVSRDTWEYLPDTLPCGAYTMDTVSKDSIRKVSHGLVLEDAAIDTLRSIMVVSETASQDGLNWGINGILVNQIGRELGMPDAYDVVKGISRLGYFDMMDFAGYNAGNGFFPAMPGAWERSYMGWSDVNEVRPVAGKKISVDVAAAGSGACATVKGSKNPCTEILKVPLNSSEYLLIENRQRSWNQDGTIDVTLNSDDEELVRSVPVDSMNLVFEDSICTKNSCKNNKSKAQGVILGVSSYDAGLPASGIAVWKINEWSLRQTLEYGYANYWGGENFRDHQFGLALIEADGVLSIGKTFKNALGEDAYDYGAGADLLPHLRIPDKDSKQKFDTVKTIGAVGYANTMTTAGGYTGIQISVAIPEDAREEKSSNGFMGDSVVNFVAPVITVTISIDDGSLKDSKFPRNLGLATAVRGVVFVDNPDEDGEKLMVVGAEDGTLQAFSALGDTLFAADTALEVQTLSLKNEVSEVPLYRVSDGNGALVGMASDGNYVYSLHEKSLVRTSFLGGMIPQREVLNLKGKALAGPVVHEGRVWLITTDALMRTKESKSGSFEWDSNVALSNFEAQDIAICGTGSDAHLVASGKDHKWLDQKVGSLMEQKGLSWQEDVAKFKEFYRVACTDMDRDGADEVLFVGSRGNVKAAVFDEKNETLKTLWDKEYKRGAAGTSGLKDETSGVAIGDVNNDGYPEIVFLGDNYVYALDRFGLPLQGFPVVINRGSPIFGFFSDPLIVDVTGDEIPEILVPSNDGLVYAISGKGKMITDGFPIAAGSFEYVDSLSQIQPMSIFVSDAVSNSSGPELYAFHRTSASAFRLMNAKSNAAESKLAWTLPAGGNERSGWFDAAALKKVEVAKAEDKISEFFMFPNPVRGGKAKAQFEIGAEAKSATLELFDVTGLCIYKTTTTDVVRGRNRIEHLDLSKLGSDVYTARLQVKFKDGKTKQKLYRVGVVR